MAQYSDIDLPLVSLCMTSFNQRDFIADALRSALDQTYSNLEIVICDDHSTDGTEKIMEDCLSRYNAYGRRQ